MSEYKFSKPYNYKNWNLFGNAIFSDVIFNDCVSSITGKCEKVKNIDECLNICDKNQKCSFGYYINTPDDKNICVPLNSKYHEKSIGPYYKLRNKNIFPILKDINTFVFTKSDITYPPNFVNTIFYTDTLILENIFSKNSIGISENNTLVSENVLSSFPAYIQFLPKEILKSLSLKYVSVKNGDEVVINIFLIKHTVFSTLLRVKIRV